MKRYKKFVLEAEKGITFKVSEGTRGELIIRALNIDKPNGYSENYKNPPVPGGYRHIFGEWNNGFVIKRCSDGSEFVWIPVGSLDSDGTLDGISFTEKFGRRFYCKSAFYNGKFHETLTDELALQIESVKKYGGFHISRYDISRNQKTGKPQSIRGMIPWIDINFYDAKKIASTIEDNKEVNSHLTFGAEYDSVLAWFIKSKARTLQEIADDSSKWGKHRDRFFTPIIGKTGDDEKYCTNNIYEFDGNVKEWTQEEADSEFVVCRGSSYIDDGIYSTVAYRHFTSPEIRDKYTGFRAVLNIK